MLKTIQEQPSRVSKDILGLSKFCPETSGQKTVKAEDLFDNFDESKKEASSSAEESFEDEPYLPVLSVEIYLNLERNKEYVLLADSMDESSMIDINSQHSEKSKKSLVEDQSMLAEWENIHNKVFFDAINEALDEFRPYGNKGPPAPWSN